MDLADRSWPLAYAPASPAARVGGPPAFLRLSDPCDPKNPMDSGNLREFLDVKTDTPPSMRRTLLVDVALGMQYLYQKQVPLCVCARACAHVL